MVANRSEGFVIQHMASDDTNPDTLLSLEGPRFLSHLAQFKEVIPTGRGP
jgi:hypothetical protein